MKLLTEALIKFACGLLLVGLLLFLPAGTLAYTYGWYFIALLFAPMLAVGFLMFFKAPAFLKKRLDAKEKQGTQKGVVATSGLMFVAGFVVAGLDFRFGWSKMPVWAVITASVLFLVAYALYAEVMRENAYLSRTIKVEEGQSVVDTGLYGIIRHPSSIKVVLSKGKKPSIEYQNALKKAESYSKLMHMSKQKIYDQLTSEYGEKFPADAAQYAIDNLNADYKANALEKADSYSKTMHMSKQKIYDQLTSEYGEKFTAEEAQYAIDNLKADYKANALEKAKSYQQTMSMSKDRIYSQLTSEYGEKFTAEEAQYAIDHLDD